MRNPSSSLQHRALEFLLERPVLERVDGDVAPTEEFSAYVQLRKRRPRRIIPTSPPRSQIVSHRAVVRLVVRVRASRSRRLAPTHFIPCLKSSFARISTSANGTFIEFKICTHVFENPHLGASFVPFMKSTTRCSATNASMDSRAARAPSAPRLARRARVRSRTARAPRASRASRASSRASSSRASSSASSSSASSPRRGLAPAPRRRRARRAIDRASSSSNLAPSIARRGRSSTRRSRRERSIDRGSRDPKIQTRPTASLIVAPRSNRRATATRAMAHRATVSVDARARGDALASRATRGATRDGARRATRGAHDDDDATDARDVDDAMRRARARRDASTCATRDASTSAMMGAETRARGDGWREARAGGSTDAGGGGGRGRARRRARAG